MVIYMPCCKWKLACCGSCCINLKNRRRGAFSYKIRCVVTRSEYATTYGNKCAHLLHWNKYLV